MKRIMNRVPIAVLLVVAAAPSLLAEGGEPLWQPSVRIRIEEPSPERQPTPPEQTPPGQESAVPTEISHRERAELLVRQDRISMAREEYRTALKEAPGDDSLRESYAWFLYSNGYHDEVCLRLLSASLVSRNASNPPGVFNAIVELRKELSHPSRPQHERHSPRGKNHAGSVVRTMTENPAKAVKPEITERIRRWSFTPYYDYSFFNKGRQGWQEEFAQILYRVNNRLILGAEIDILERPPSGTNTYYSALASFYAWKFLEVHGKISICPAPTFAATQIYSGGIIYQAAPRLGLLFDYQRYNFLQGPIDQLSPGIVWNFSDDSSLALRYTRGWAFYDLQYNYYSAALNLGLPGKRKLTMAFAYGTDPDSEIGSGGSNVTSLTPAYAYSLFLSQPLTRDLTLLAGIQYVYRLKESGGELYQQLTPTLGCTYRF